MNSYEDIGFAHIDYHRAVRQGFPEVIYGAGKTQEQILAIMQKLLAADETGEKNILATQISKEKADFLCAHFSEGVYDEIAKAFYIQRKKFLPTEDEKLHKKILIITAGTSDIPVAQEAKITAELMQNYVETIFDVGVAGIHRLLAHQKEIASANVIIVIAGMEGALASVVGGMTSRPVIAVPTSVGYGASFGGLAALLAMLNCCSAGVAVMNIDNGFGAGVLASKINH